MEAELIEKLSRVNEFSDDLVNIITAITRDIHRPAWDIYTAKLAVILVNFTCQPKISYMRKSPSAAIAINSAKKTLEDYCLDLILRLLLKLLKLKQDMVMKVTELFLEVIETNVNNVDTIILFYRIMFFSEKVVNYVLENNYLGIFIEQYEKIINQILHEFENSERSIFINETLRTYFYGGTDFITNLNKHIQAIGASTQMELPSNIPNYPNTSQIHQDDDFNNRGPYFPQAANLEQIQNDALNNPVGTNNPNSEQSSFYLPTGNTTNHASQSKSVKIPILNLPASFNDNANTISRSTRRADPYKSFSTNSNRISNYGIGSASMDYGAKDTTFQKNINENNISILDNENSYFYDDPLKVGVYQSAQDRMKSLANQLGEYCLTIDLGCLLAQKRKLQLDQVAHVAVFQDVDAIMDFKAEENILREKLTKKRHKPIKKSKLSRKSVNLGLGMNPEIKEVESSENEDNESDGEAQTPNMEGTMSPQKANTRKGSDKSDKKTDKQAARNKKMNELKQTWKAAHVMSNILLLLLKEVDYEKLQQYGSLINMLYLALSTDISQRFRYKEKAKLALNLNYWVDTMDDEFTRHDQLCEGIDNVERINRHFEKTLVEKHKARQVAMQQNNNGGNGNNQMQNSVNLQQASSFPTNQGSMMKSVTQNDSRKKGGYLGQKSLTFDMNTTNMKYFDSTVLHFSTTYDNENSSALTIPDESIDSIDELNVNQNLMNVDFILLPENVVYFKILDLFAVISEKVHETLSVKYQNAFDLEKPVDIPIAFPEGTPASYLNKSRMQSEKEKVLDSSSLVKEFPGDSELKISIKGLDINPAEDNNARVIKKRSNVFLHKYEKKLSWILNQVDMNSAFFYDMEVEQLEILEGYLEVNTSKITTFEVIDNVFELLLLVKKQIIDLASSFLTGPNTNTTTTRVVSPNLTAKAHRPGSMTRDLPIPSAPTSSTNVANNILKSVLRTNPSSRNLVNQDVSPHKGAMDMTDNNRTRFGAMLNSPFFGSFIYKQKELYMTYVGIVTKLILRAPKLDIYNLLNDVYTNNENWMELIKLFTVSIFREIMAICERTGESNDVTLEKEQIHLFLHAKKILEYYTSVLVMCNTIIFKEKLNTNANDPAKKKWKNVLRRILHSMLYLVKSHNGILAKFLSYNTNINSIIINPKVQSLSNYNLVRIHLFGAVYDFLRKIFSFPARFSCFLTDEISTFYIRFSYINFVKLYSHSSNSELNEINKKIVEIGNRVKSKVGQENFNENFENEFNRRTSKSNNELKTYQIHLSKQYVKVLLSISKNRNDDIKHKFYQYRILEFFTREIDLEFDISQIRERFLRIRNEAKKNMMDKKDSPIPQMPVITGMKRDRKSQNEADEESKGERVETYTSDVKVTNLSDADLPFQPGSKAGLVGLKQRLNIGVINPAFAEKGSGKVSAGGAKRFENVHPIEENANQPSYTSEDFFGQNHFEHGPNDASSPRVLRMQKRNSRTKSTPFEKDDILEIPKLSSQIIDISPKADSRIDDTPFEYSTISNDFYRPPHAVFQAKRSAVPALNLHGSTTSLYGGRGAESQLNSPAKADHTLKDHFEQEYDQDGYQKQQPDSRKFRLSIQQTKNVEELIRQQQNELDNMHEDQSIPLSETGQHYNYYHSHQPQSHHTPGMSRVEPIMHQKLKNMIKQDLGLMRPKPDYHQHHKTSLKMEEVSSASRKMRNSIASIDNDKLSVQSRRRLELNEMKEGGVMSSRRTASKQEISDRDWQKQQSSKRNIIAQMSPLQPLKLSEFRQDRIEEEAQEFPKSVKEEDVEEERKSYEPHVYHHGEGVHGGHEEERPTHTETYRTEESSEVSMGEMIQQEMEFKKALEAQRGKKVLPSLQLPSFLTEKGHLYGVDAKYAGSPRDSDRGEDDNKPRKLPMRRTEDFHGQHQYQSQGHSQAQAQAQGQNVPFKKVKVPSLKIGVLTKEEKHLPQQQEVEIMQGHYAGGNLTQLEHSLNASNSKTQVILDAKRKQQQQHHSPKFNLKSFAREFPLMNANMDEMLTENLFYYSERKLRKIYEDDELHVLVVSLMISLLLTPHRGILDEHYTSQYPVDDGKPNILYIMHFHLNHPSNQHILPLLLSEIAEVNPYPAGQRLLKLLCISFSDMSIYTDKKKIGGGAYGTVFECNTNLADPRTVAIKETKFPSSIHDRCVLHDIFTEIACLEHFRLDPAVTDLYDYGVTDSSYIIVMKKYPVSLREWRHKQEGNWMDNLPTYLTIYKDILKATAMLHSHNITHYDLKSDNVLLDYKTNPHMKWNSESDIRVVLGDFGECKMFTGEQDEHCLRNRGTDYIKSPEMLTIPINCKREADHFDRRRKVGTTRASDIWSLGCLLYEILTGDFLFYDKDYFQFHIRVTTPTEILFTEDKLSKIGNNVYIVDFLRYILVREPQHRPSINNVLKRFEHIHAILVSNITYLDHYTLSLPPHQNNPMSNMSLEGTLESYVELLFPNQGAIQERITIPHKLKHPPTYMKIMDEISICAKTYFLTNTDKLVRNGVTHVISTTNLIEEKYLARFRYMVINLTEDQRLQMLPYILAPRVMDYLRVVFLYKGNVLFVEDDNININSKPSKLVLRTTLLFCLTHFFKCSVYETWTLINSQILFFSLPFSHLSMMSNLMVHHFKLAQFVYQLPKIQCICGCCTLVLKRQFNLDKNVNTKPCSCSRETKTIEFSDCPSDGCAEYMKYIKDKFRIPWETLKWVYFSAQDLFIGPKGTGSLQEKFYNKIILNSEGIQENSVQYQKKYRKANVSYQSLGGSNKDKWDIYQCKFCLMWLFAENKTERKYAVVTNNMVKQKQGGIMSPQAQFGHKIKVPTLRNFKLADLR